MTWDLIGHSWAVELLQGHLARDRVRHAYLFTGPEGVGRMALALGFARRLACLKPPAPGEACTVCRPCRQVPSLTDPDLHVVVRGEDESQIKIEQIRALQRQLSLAPFAGRRRIALLVDFHDASAEAQNALLKTLEEPPTGVVLLLTALDREILLPTIGSRCEEIALRPVPLADLRSALVERGAAPELATRVASWSAGRPGYALRALADPKLLEERSRMLDELQQVLTTGLAGQFEYADRVAGRQSREPDAESKRRRTTLLLETWRSLWRDALFAAHRAEGMPVNPDRSEQIAGLAAALGSEGVSRALHAIERALEAVRRNANPQLVLEVLFLDLDDLRAGGRSTG